MAVRGCHAIAQGVPAGREVARVGGVQHGADQGGRPGGRASAGQPDQPKRDQPDRLIEPEADRVGQALDLGADPPGHSR